MPQKPESFVLPQSKIERHYRQKELEALFNVSPTAIYNLVRAGKLKRKKFGRTNLYAESDVMACLNYH